MLGFVYEGITQDAISYPVMDILSLTMRSLKLRCNPSVSEVLLVLIK